ncbi:MAG TPA: biotin/lipoyl-binding protein [Nannocystaceae bacterium]|nr:biotin/lipoyl-binding protein [Nannocystaceae bacterium]
MEQATVTEDPAAAPAPPHAAAAEQAAVWRHARATRWYHRTSARLVLAVAALVGALAVVPWPLYVTADCVIIPSERAYVRSPIAGEIAEILVDEASHVAKGEVIARLDDRHLVAERAKAAADIARIEAELTRLRHGHRKVRSRGSARSWRRRPAMSSSRAPRQTGARGCTAREWPRSRR